MRKRFLLMSLAAFALLATLLLSLFTIPAAQSAPALTVVIVTPVRVTGTATYPDPPYPVPGDTTPPGPVFLPIIMRHPCQSPFPGDLQFMTFPSHVMNVQAEFAWHCVTGRGILIGIMDSGVDGTHPNLAPNMVPGYSNVPNEPDPGASGNNVHGTHVAGISGAAPNSGQTLGVAPTAGITSIKVLSSAGSGYDWNVADGILKATDRGVKVLNISLGRPQYGPEWDTLIHDHVRYAHQRNVLLIAAAGNCGDPGTWRFNGCTRHNSPSIPAAFAEVVAIGSVGLNNSRSAFSTQGSYVELAALGDSVFSTIPGNRYASYSGTSMASPVASGVAALIWSRNPSLTATQVRHILQASATDLGPAGRDGSYGYGLVNAQAALERAFNPPSGPAGVEPVSVSGTGEFAAPDSADNGTLFAPGQLILSLEPGYAPAGVITAAGLFSGLTVAETISGHDLYLLNVPAGDEIALATLLRDQPGVRGATLNFVVTNR
jgi:subtilisin family serine protease